MEKRTGHKVSHLIYINNNKCKLFNKDKILALCILRILYNQNQLMQNLKVALSLIIKDKI